MASDNLRFTDFLSVPEAAVVCRVSRVTIHRWVQRGKLDAVYIGKARFVQKGDIESICAARDGTDVDARLRNVLVRRTPGWTFSLVGGLTDRGPNTVAAIGPGEERILFRFEVLESKGSEREHPRQA